MKKVLGLLFVMLITMFALEMTYDRDAEIICWFLFICEFLYLFRLVYKNL